ncbi:4-hydroxyphenylpyruvate dioxygenase [Sporothrix brasiliensis 5110]|uniref:4-hydroxyphenylpyruvate dioxygenase n=1 Tax=Sporothrix brasiliensis 5110 TaxID=1398154 RepID=A0A0C2ITY9_9PEZI|nr:4-hydroxyphenylpyruvate dioxygenase [Sporothrix brasiliensis 5110]KIH90240.1 4-hydroxyphenylpyruvate dioxygenase [Sporothrix brasiliensis 5110]
MPCRLSISTLSLGQSYAGHSLEQRLDQASQHGYQGIELFYDDLEYIAQTLPLVPPSSFTTADSTDIPTTILMAAPTTAPTDSQLVRAAALVRALCAERRLAVICLQPFRHFEGLVSRDARAHRLAQLRLWCRLAGILRTDLILIPSNFLPAGQVTGEFKFIVQDLREAAEIAAAATPPVRLCYEALAWGTHIDTWQASWEVAQQVDRPNFGLCLDTFNIAARVYADPAVSGGVQPDGPLRLSESMKELAATVSVDRVFLVQIADGARLAAPLVPGHPLYDADSPARMTWSRQHRLFYGEDDRSGYLPVDQVLAAILGDLGYRGWLSFELFNRRTSGTDASVPAEMAW